MGTTLIMGLTIWCYAAMIVRDGEVTAIEVKSGRRGMNSGLPSFVETFDPKRSFVVGTGGVSLENSLIRCQMVLNTN